MGAESKAQLLARGMAAAGRGDVDVLRSTMSEDIVWHVPGTSDLAGDYSGPDAVIGLLGQLFGRTGGDVHPVDVLEGESHVMSFTSFEPAQGDALVFADAFRFDDDGRVAEYWTLPEDLDAWDRLLGEG